MVHANSVFKLHRGQKLRPFNGIWKEVEGSANPLDKIIFPQKSKEFEEIFLDMSYVVTDAVFLNI